MSGTECTQLVKMNYQISLPLTFQAQLLLYAPSGFTQEIPNNNTFRIIPTKVFYYSPTQNYRTVFTIESERVYCAVRNQIVN